MMIENMYGNALLLFADQCCSMLRGKLMQKYLQTSQHVSQQRWQVSQRQNNKINDQYGCFQK